MQGFLRPADEHSTATPDAAMAAMQQHGIALKHPTVTEKESPNKVLRERCDFSVIHRPVATLPGVKTRHDGKVDLHVIRVAVGGTFGGDPDGTTPFPAELVIDEVRVLTREDAG